MLSLQYANPDPHRVIEKEQYRSEQAGRDVDEFKSSIVPYRLEERIYVLYTAKIYPRQFPDRDFQDLSDDDKIIIQTILDGFETIEKDCAEAGSPLLWYKQPDLSEVVRQVDRVQWRQPVATVGGNLLSNLITGHGLPNANHRTSISFLETYLQTFDSTFEIPDTGVDDEWYDWSADFVQESKRLLMLSRKSPISSTFFNGAVNTLAEKMATTYIWIVMTFVLTIRIHTFLASTESCAYDSSTKYWSVPDMRIFRIRKTPESQYL